jgi:RNA polymerase sigma-70 factor (ECF subfamily)
VPGALLQSRLMVTAATLPADPELVRALRAGDESVFMDLVQRWHASMLRVALMYVPSRAVAEEVVQETWLGVLTGIDRFEERSSLRTWVYRILTNRAKTRGERERRTVPFSSLVGAESERDDPAVDPSRFRGPEDSHPGGWASPPQAWPQERLLAAETLGVINDAIDALPEAQRIVITMRDVEGFGAEEVAELLDISAVNQRVLLHRARSKVRAALEAHLA